MGVELLQGATGGEPALEVALAAALLRAVASGRRGPALRCYRPPPTVAFGRRDALLPGFGAAAAAARAHGFAPVIRAPGGRAAAYHEGCLVFDEIFPVADWLTGIQERFHRDAEHYAQALRGLGIDARVGQVPGEYCPGTFSINAGGRRKLAGAAQRLVKGGWLLSTFVVVEGSSALRSVLVDVYEALGLEWDPSTAGAVAEEAPGLTVDAVRDALLGLYSERYRLRPGEVEADVLAAAEALVGGHRA